MASCNKVFEVTKAYLIAEPTGLYVRAWGVVRTNASNPRLVRSSNPHVTTALGLDFCCDPGPLQILTEVEAIYPVDSLEGIEAIEVHGDSNSVTIRVAAKAA